MCPMRRLGGEAIGMRIERPDLSFQNGPLMPVVLPLDPIVRFTMNQREQPNNGIASSRKAGRQWYNGLIDFEAVISHDVRFSGDCRGFTTSSADFGCLCTKRRLGR